MTTAARAALLLLAPLLIGTLSACGSSGELIIVVTGKSPRPDGSFITRDHGTAVKPTEVRMVLGDLRFRTPDPGTVLQTFPSLEPLLEPGERAETDQLGRNGEFPGLWVADLLPGKTTLLGPGEMAVGTYREAVLRISQATPDVQGLRRNDPLTNLSLIFRGIASLPTGSCSFSLEMPFELGIGLRTNFEVKEGYTHRLTATLDYQTWFAEVSFEDPCKGSGSKTVVIDQSRNTALYDKVRGAIPASLALQPEAGR